MKFTKKHFYDSLLPFLHRDFNNLCDVGAGAGFPSIPVKILYPHLEVTILEPLAKRVRFLEHLCEKLQLKDVNCLHVRAEEYARDHRECFEIVSARAVANLPVLSELCLPLVKENGLFIAMKGLNAAVEIQAAEHAVKTLGAILEEQKESMLSDGAKARQCDIPQGSKDAETISPQLRKDKKTPFVGDDRMRESKIVSIDEISPNPYQPRIDFDDEGLMELSQSIRENGLNSSDYCAP